MDTQPAHRDTTSGPCQGAGPDDAPVRAIGDVVESILQEILMRRLAAILRARAGQRVGNPNCRRRYVESARGHCGTPAKGSGARRVDRKRSQPRAKNLAPFPAFIELGLHGCARRR